MSKNIVVLLSGRGSNFKAILQSIHDGEIQAQITAVISNNAQASGLNYAKQHGIKTCVLEQKDFEPQLIALLHALQPDLIVLAGFMRILGPACVHQFAGRIINIHPSLLPQYKGLNTHQRVLDAGDTKHGCSTHFVTTDLDGGPIIMQAEVAVETNDTAESLASKVLEQEHIIYSQSIALFCTGRLRMEDGKCVLDEEVMEEGMLMV